MLWFLIAALLMSDYSVEVIRAEATPYTVSIKRAEVATAKSPVNPANAAVIVYVTGKDAGGVSRTYFGCGCILPGSQVLTCNHLTKGLTGVKYSVDRQGRIPATLISRDAKADLCLLEIDSDLPGVELAETNARGSVSSFNHLGQPVAGAVIAVDSPDMTFTNQRLEPGDSGAALFVGNCLAGVFVGKDASGRRLFVNVREIRRFLGLPYEEPPPKAEPKVAATEKTVDGHSHKCWRCGTVWAHTAASFGSRAAHTCPKCRSLQFDVHQEHVPVNVRVAE